ncbi:MAG: N-acetylmuramoyl-L-alanine amidase [Polyangiaceae bacterium]
MPASAESAGRDLALARTMGDEGGALGSRPSALAVVDRVVDQALREGAGGRAAQLHSAAARVLERLWRVYGERPDALRAVDEYTAAARQTTIPGACEAALRGALLAGDLAEDASVAYVELDRVGRRFDAFSSPDAAGTSCRQLADRSLALLGPSRPPEPVLDAVDSPRTNLGPPPRVARLGVWPGRDSARIVVEIDQPAAYRVDDETLGAATARTFIDLDGVDLAGEKKDLRTTGIVTRIRAEATSTGSRVVLDLDGHVWRRVFYMREPYRIVIDVARHPPGAEGGDPREVARVVLDAGHGGKDTGAMGPGGLTEKEVTLDISERAARILTDQGLSVLLTRTDDRFVTLEERTARANDFSADLFVSIHCNASEGHARRGVEAYVLDTTRDEIAARIASRENQTTPAANADLAAMLSAMRLADQAQRSMHFARLLEKSSVATLRMKYEDTVDGGVHPAGFYVLVGARMPGVLFEASYISNAKDEQRLATAEYRQLLADALANAVKAYREGR